MDTRKMTITRKVAYRLKKYTHVAPVIRRAQIRVISYGRSAAQSMQETSTPHEQLVLVYSV